MTAHNASSAPTHPNHEFEIPMYDNDEPSSETDDFLASLVFDSRPNSDDGYHRADRVPVQITALMTSDDLLLTHDTKNKPATFTAPPNVVAATSSSQNETQWTTTEKPLSYTHSFKDELKTIVDVHRHEARLYRRGYTPATIRHNTKFTLQTMRPEQHLEDFPKHYIPPPERDHHTYMALTDLRKQQKETYRIMNALSHRVGLENVPKTADEEETYHRLDANVNAINRSMYQIFADSAYVIHDNNFTAFCKPHLTNLPPGTAFELETLRLQLEEKEKAPYRPIYKDALPDPTKPTL